MAKKINRLLINMKNKIDVLNGSINMVYKMKRGETITLNGLHRLEVGMNEDTPKEEFTRLIDELVDERDNLQELVNRMGG